MERRTMALLLVSLIATLTSTSIRPARALGATQPIGPNPIYRGGTYSYYFLVWPGVPVEYVEVSYGFEQGALDPLIVTWNPLPPILMPGSGEYTVWFSLTVPADAPFRRYDVYLVVAPEIGGVLNVMFTVTITETPPPPVVAATVNIDPDTLNLRSKGEWVTAYIELPESYNVANMNASSIMLNHTVPVEPEPLAIGDYDGNTIPDLMVRFNRTAVQEFMLSKGIKYGNVTLILTGQLDNGSLIEGSDIIRVRMPGDINIDGKVDIKDLALTATAFGSYLGHARWNYVADENEDNKIDIKDLALIARNFGKIYL